jgi:hypothetical protein
MDGQVDEDGFEYVELLGGHCKQMWASANEVGTAMSLYRRISHWERICSLELSLASQYVSAQRNLRVEDNPTNEA